VVLGGIHVTALPDEAGRHADAIVIGEAEGIWEELLTDAAARRLKPVYQGGFPQLDGLPRPVTNLWQTNYVYGYFQTSRGCPHRCTFCSVHQFFGVRSGCGPSTRWWRRSPAASDDCSGDRRQRLGRQHELHHRALRGDGADAPGKSWFGSGDLVSVDHPRSGELLRNARRAGLTAVLVGWESNNLGSLEEYQATTKQGRQRRDAIKKIRDHGIEVMLFMMIGGRQDRRKITRGSSSSATS